MIFHLPHAWLHIPPDLRSAYLLDDRALAAESLVMTDAYTWRVQRTPFGEHHPGRHDVPAADPKGVLHRGLVSGKDEGSAGGLPGEGQKGGGESVRIGYLNPQRPQVLRILRCSGH